MTTKKLFIGVLILIAVLAVSAFSWAAISRFNESQLTSTRDLPSLNVSNNANDTTNYYFRHPELSASGFETPSSAIHYGPPGR